MESCVIRVIHDILEASQKSHLFAFIHPEITSGFHTDDKIKAAMPNTKVELEKRMQSMDEGVTFLFAMCKGYILYMCFSTKCFTMPYSAIYVIFHLYRCHWILLVMNVSDRRIQIYDPYNRELNDGYFDPIKELVRG